MGTRLVGKSALVTGGGKGLGREIALAYAEEGANVAVAARSAADIENVAAEIGHLGRRGLAVPCDVRDDEQVARMVQRTIGEFGKLDILVNNAGSGGVVGPVWETTVAQWQAVFDAYLTGAFRCIRATMPHMIKQGGGIIINMSSWVGQPGEHPVGFGAYAIAKWGIEGLTELLASEAARYNIRVNAIRPGGVVATPALFRNGPVQERLDFFNRTNRHAPVVRPDIIRPVAVFAASDQSIGVTGQSLESDTYNLNHGYGDVSRYRYVITNDPGGQTQIPSP